MKKRQKLLTDEQRELVEPMLPPPRRRQDNPDNRGRPWASNRACFEAILWILQTGAAWRFVPEEFASSSTLRPAGGSAELAWTHHLIAPRAAAEPDAAAGHSRCQRKQRAIT